MSAEVRGDGRVDADTLFGQWRSRTSPQPSRGAIGELIAFVNRTTPMLSSRVEHGARQYASAALARGCDLLQSGLTLIVAGKWPPSA